jgi:hypothetical protein
VFSSNEPRRGKRDVWVCVAVRLFCNTLVGVGRRWQYGKCLPFPCFASPPHNLTKFTYSVLQVCSLDAGGQAAPRGPLCPAQYQQVSRKLASPSQSVTRRMARPLPLRRRAAEEQCVAMAQSPPIAPPIKTKGTVSAPSPLAPFPVERPGLRSAYHHSPLAPCDVPCSQPSPTIMHIHLSDASEVSKSANGKHADPYPHSTTRMKCGHPCFCIGVRATVLSLCAPSRRLSIVSAVRSDRC